MKIRILDRILVALAGLLVLAGCAALAAQLFFGKDVIGFANRILADGSLRVWIIAALAVLILLGCYCVLILFRHRGRKDKFVMQKTENGELAISLKAMETMVQKCLEPHKELNVQSVRLENQKGGLLIRIRGTVAGGVSIPLTVDALQQQIKQYVTACSGVEVKDIRVQIESSGPEAKESLYAIEAPTARALPSPAKEKEEKPKEEEAVPEIAPITPEEIEQLTSEKQAPQLPEEENETPQVVVPAAAAAAAEMLQSEVPPEEDDRPIHQRLFSSPEQPCVMPMPPDAEEKAADEAAEKQEEAEKKEAEAAKPEEKPAEKETAADAQTGEGSENA